MKPLTLLFPALSPLPGRAHGSLPMPTWSAIPGDPHTPPFSMRNFVAFGKYDVFSNCGLAALRADVRNKLDIAPRNRLSFLIDARIESFLVAERTAARTAIATDPTCYSLPIMGVVFHCGPVLEPLLLFHAQIHKPIQVRG